MSKHRRAGFATALPAIGLIAATIAIDSQPQPLARTAASAAPAPARAVDRAFVRGWGTPTWRDEFNGTRLNTKKWTAKSGVLNTDSDGWMDPSAVRERHGSLILRATRQTDPANRSRTWKTGYVTTQGHFSARFGRWEVRYRSLKPSVSRGIWFTPWVRDDHGGGEIDISESVGTRCAHPTYYPDNGSASSSTMYTHTGVGTIGATRTANTLFTYKPVPMAERTHGRYYGWHVGVLVLLPHRATVFSDGVKVLQVTTATALGRSIIRRGFPSAQHMRLSQHVGSDWAGHPDATTANPYRTKVDYVRFWRYTPRS